MKRFIPIIIFALLGLAFAIGLTRDPRQIDTVILDKPFPEFSLQTLHDPNTLKTQAVLNDHVSLVNVFGSWCIACTAEHEQLMDMAQRENIRIIGINWRDTRIKGQDWLARRGNPYSEIIFDPESILAVQLGVVGAPETFITDSLGRIRYKHVGPISTQDWETTLKPLMQKLAAQ